MFDFISQNIDIILIVIVAVFLIWNVLLEIRLKKERQRINSFFKGKKTEDLEGVISEILRRERKTEIDLQKIFKKLKTLDEIALKSIQKVGIVRFNPFEGIGGNQSFSIALLDQKDAGVVISSYHSKDTTRVYAKPIKNGESEYPLSKEEEEAIKRAIGS
ncbi:MAG: DUF4446 family protein [Minisyncoccales bacterium]